MAQDSWTWCRGFESHLEPHIFRGAGAWKTLGWPWRRRHEEHVCVDYIPLMTHLSTGPGGVTCLCRFDTAGAGAVMALEKNMYAVSRHVKHLRGTTPRCSRVMRVRPVKKGNTASIAPMGTLEMPFFLSL